MQYDISKEKGGRYFITCNGNPVPGSYNSDKKKVIKQAAKMNGMSTKDFLKGRK